MNDYEDNKLTKISVFAGTLRELSSRGEDNSLANPNTGGWKRILSLTIYKDIVRILAITLIVALWIYTWENISLPVSMVCWLWGREYPCSEPSLLWCTAGYYYRRLCWQDNYILIYSFRKQNTCPNHFIYYTNFINFDLNIFGPHTLSLVLDPPLTAYCNIFLTCVTTGESLINIVVTVIIKQHKQVLLVLCNWVCSIPSQ